MDNDVREILKRQLERLDVKASRLGASGAEQLARISGAMCAIVDCLDRLDRLTPPTIFGNGAKRREDDKAAEAATSAAERNTNWAELGIPEDCKSIIVCMDRELFDRKKQDGIIPLHDDRGVEALPPDLAIPCFIGYYPADSQTSQDTQADLHEAK